MSKKTAAEIAESLEQSRINTLIKADEARYHKELLDDAKRTGVSVVHVFNELSPQGGLTIAFRKAKPGQTSTNMVTVAVAACSFHDVFSRKIGSTIALDKFFDEQTIDLPLSFGYEGEDLAGAVKRKFTAMYFTY